MCLILLAYEMHPAYRLVVAANRDEFHARPTAVAGFWPDEPELLGGRDLQSKGTWLGVTLGGRLAAVTNYREPGMHQNEAASRGWLVRDFLRGGESPGEFLRGVDADRYNGFCMLAAAGGELGFLSNRDDGPRSLAPGLYGLSNHLLDTPWPKVEKGKRELQEFLDQEARIDPEKLFRLLADRTTAADKSLPDTGVGLERERILSPIFTTTPEYGTRCSTVILAGPDGRVVFVERSYDRFGELTGTVEFEFGGSMSR